jgi:hypothetical protein
MDKSALIDKYVCVLLEYLLIMQESEVVLSLHNREYAIQLGIAAISHIFKLTFIQTKDIVTAETNCQKGIYCYIEYIEQFHKLNSTQSIDFADALGFIYDKTLSDIHSFTNIMQEEDYTFLLNDIGAITSHLLWLNNSNISLLDHIDILETHLRYFIFLVSDKDYKKYIFLLFETIQNHIVNVNANEYHSFISQIIKKIDNNEITSAVFEACSLFKANYSGETLQNIAANEEWIGTRKATNIPCELVKVLCG